MKEFIKKNCVDSDGNPVLISDIYNELSATGDVICTPPLNGI